MAASPYQAYIFTVTTDAKKPVRQDGLLHLSDAWQFMAGVLPATLRAVAAQRVLTDRLQIKQKALSSDRALRFI
ncbi:hypothetical protein UL297_001723 [Salmonella enterica]|nr:hypothetical protein [Salmonella enterica]EDP9257662.1 hypothetical protein [Salmonella enterica subsp. enterica serovar Newmexico]EDJ7029934.1 hypothetical protein [Salmonella enterica]EII9573228.1 hypothetical protein [Salmonella enterica]EJJ1408928.1 hypothetical protein [Salmonella enterica]